VEPAGSLPLLTLDSGGSIVIVNLQRTPNDKETTLWCFDTLTMHTISSFLPFHTQYSNYLAGISVDHH
jgi:hypothetical protein